MRLELIISVFSILIFGIACSSDNDKLKTFEAEFTSEQLIKFYENEGIAKDLLIEKLSDSIAILESELSDQNDTKFISPDTFKTMRNLYLQFDLAIYELYENGKLSTPISDHSMEKMFLTNIDVISPFLVKVGFYDGHGVKSITYLYSIINKNEIAISF